MNRPTLSPSSWVFGLGVLVVAFFLLVLYVNLLRDAVARGSQSRYVQNESRAAPANVRHAVALEASP